MTQNSNPSGIIKTKPFRPILTATSGSIINSTAKATNVRKPPKKPFEGLGGTGLPYMIFVISNRPKEGWIYYKSFKTLKGAKQSLSIQKRRLEDCRQYYATPTDNPIVKITTPLDFIKWQGFLSEFDGSKL